MKPKQERQIDRVNAALASLPGWEIRDGLARCREALSEAEKLQIQIDELKETIEYFTDLDNAHEIIADLKRALRQRARK